ncbi:hypothetical protein FACS1894156_1860 [Bacteroidia bacterium]|nr:hypothetical protein FACS1894156_1860 [Bacteroidia bacterium]
MQINHEFAFYGAGGFSTLMYSPEVGKRHWGFGGGGGLSYSYFFNQHWGLSLGAEIMAYNARYTADIESVQKNAYDGEEDLDYYYNLKKYVERQNLVMVNIPLMVRFQTPIDKQKDFYAALGGRVGLPLSGHYRSTAGEITTSGYFPSDQSTLEGPEFRGFGTQSFVKKDNSDLKFSTSYLASAELGIKWHLKQNWLLYTGLYVDYGINNISPKGTESMVTYNAENVNNPQFNPNSNFPANYYNSNSVLASTHTTLDESKTVDMTKKVIPFATGVKVTLAFGKGNPKKQAPAKAPAKTDTAKRRVDKFGEEPQLDLLPSYQPRSYQTSPKRKGALLGTVDNYPLKSTTLTQAQKTQLKKTVEYLKNYTNVTVVCIGHAGDLGSEEANDKLALSRATAVRNYLIGQGIVRTRVTVKSFGQLQPRVPNTTDANRKLNRRVEIKVNKK